MFSHPNWNLFAMSTTGGQQDTRPTLTCDIIYSGWNEDRPEVDCPGSGLFVYWEWYLYIFLSLDAVKILQLCRVSE